MCRKQRPCMALYPYGACRRSVANISPRFPVSGASKDSRQAVPAPLVRQAMLTSLVRFPLRSAKSLVCSRRQPRPYLTVFDRVLFDTCRGSVRSVIPSLPMSVWAALLATVFATRVCLACPASAFKRQTFASLSAVLLLLLLKQRLQFPTA